VTWPSVSLSQTAPSLLYLSTAAFRAFHVTAPAHLPYMLLVSSAPLPPPLPLMRQGKLFPLSTFRYYICEAQRSPCYHAYVVDSARHLLWCLREANYHALLSLWPQESGGRGPPELWP
jgi:hypothetical protein